MTEPPLTGAELDMAIIDAARAYIAAARAFPRDRELVAARLEALNDLRALRAG